MTFNIVFDRINRSPVTAIFIAVLSLVTAIGNSMSLSKGGQQTPALQNDVIPFNPYSGMNVTFDQLQRLRIDVIKQDILSKLGMTNIPDVSNVHTTVQERREIIRLYKKSVEELQGRTQSVFDEQQFSANQFDSFTDTGNWCKIPYASSQSSIGPSTFCNPVMHASTSTTT
jgi:hypothetical protein